MAHGMGGWEECTYVQVGSTLRLRARADARVLTQCPCALVPPLRGRSAHAHTHTRTVFALLGSPGIWYAYAFWTSGRTQPSIIFSGLFRPPPLSRWRCAGAGLG